MAEEQGTGGGVPHWYKRRTTTPQMRLPKGPGGFAFYDVPTGFPRQPWQNFIPFSDRRRMRLEANRIGRNTPRGQELMAMHDALQPVGTQKWSPEYDPTWWENPINVARAYHQYKATKPGDVVPDWYDAPAIEQAYQYYKFANNDAPWWEWKYLAPDDPGRSFLQGINQPDLSYTLPNDQYHEYILATLAQQDPNQWDEKLLYDLPPQHQKALREYRDQVQSITPYEDLPAWQRVMTDIMSSPATSGVATMLPFAVIGGVAGIATGGLGAAALGLGLPLLLGGLGGAAAAKYPTAADLMMKLDIPAEWVEQGIGLGIQAIDSLRDPAQFGTFDEFINNLDAAKQAAHLTYASEFNFIPNIPAGLEWVIRSISGDHPEQVQFAQPGQVWVLGQKEPVNIGPYGTAALVQIRREIMAGNDAQQVIDEWNQKLGFNAQFSELVGHIVLDPLNLLPHATSKGVSLYGRLTGDVAMATAFEHAGPFQGWKKYREFIRSNLGGKYIPTEMDAFHLFAGGLTEEGIPKELAIDVTPTNPIQRAFAHLFGLTPDAQARVFTEMQADNWSNAWHDHARANPDLQVDLFKRVASMTPDQSAMLSSELGSAAMYVGQRAMQGITPKLETLLESYHNADPQRALLFRLIDIMQQVDPSKAKKAWGQEILLRLGSVEDADTFVRQILNNLDQFDPQLAADLRGADFNAESVKLMMDAFTGEDPIPWHPDEFAAKGLMIISSGMGEWSAKAYGVQPMGPVSRFFDTLKRAQTFVLLGWNPAYAINNEISNTVHRAATGIWGYTPNGVIDNFLARWGVEPYRLEAGIGIANLSPEIQAGIEPESAIGQPYGATGMVTAGELPIRKATQPPKSAIDPARRVLDSANKFAAFSNLSRWFEVQESRQAWYRGLTKTWNELHVRGKGFQVMSPYLKNMLIQGGVDPEVVYRAIEGSVTADEVRVKLGNLRERRVTGYDLNDVIPDVARELGYDVGDVREMLSPVFDQFNEAVTRSDNPDDLIRAFNDVRKHMDDMMDEALAYDLNTRVSQIVQQVKSGGFTEFARVMDDYHWRVEEFWIQHFQDWEETFQLVDQMQANGASWEAIQTQFRLAADRANKAWKRMDEFQRATIQGSWDALGTRRDITAAYLSRMDDIRETWRKFYNYKSEAYESLWSQKLEPEAYAVEKGKLEVELNERYNDANSEVAQLAREADDMYVKIVTEQFGQDVGDAARAWRTNVQGLDDIRRQLMTEFRDRTLTMNTSERRTAWKAFLEEEYLPSIIDYMGEESAGPYRIWKTATGEEIFRPTRPPGEEPPTAAPTGPPPEEPPPQPVGPEVPPEQPPAPTGEAVQPPEPTQPTPEELSSVMHEENLRSVADEYNASIWEAQNVVNKYLRGGYGEVAEGWRTHPMVERGAFGSIEPELMRDALEARRIANLEPEPIQRVVPIEAEQHPDIPDYIKSLRTAEGKEYARALDNALRRGEDINSVTPPEGLSADLKDKIATTMRQFYMANIDEAISLASDLASYYTSWGEFRNSPDFVPLIRVFEMTHELDTVDTMIQLAREMFDEEIPIASMEEQIRAARLSPQYQELSRIGIPTRETPPEPVLPPEEVRTMAQDVGLTPEEIDAIRSGEMTPDQIEEVVRRVTQPRPREVTPPTGGEGPGAEVPRRRIEPGAGAAALPGGLEAPRVRAPAPVSPGDVGVPEYLRAIVRPNLEYEITNPRVSEILREEMGQQTDLRRIFSNYQRGNRAYLLANGTGTGKTYVAMGVIEEMNPKNTLVVMPSRNIFGEWDEAASLFNRKLAKGSKPPDEGVFLTTYAWLGQNRDKIAGKNYDLIIFDESHRLKGSGQWAQGGEFAIGDNPNAKILFQSATPFQSAGEMEYLKYLNLWDTKDAYGFDRFLMDHNYHWVQPGTGQGFWRFDGTVDDILDIYRQINEKGLGSTRKLVIDQNLDNRFARVALDPRHSQIYADANNAFDTAASTVNGRYKAMIEAQRTIALRRILEMSKVDDTIKIAQQMLGEGKQVAIFTGYKGELKAPTFKSPRMRHVNNILADFYSTLAAEEGQTVARLVDALGGEKVVAVITGDVPERTRKVEINNYMSGRKKVVVATAASGGTGLSLHDKVGNAPRAQINMYLPWSGQDFEQIAGRSYRYGSASPVVQYWLFGDAPKEASIAQVVGARLEEMGGLVSGIEKDFNATKLQAFDFGLLGDERLVDDILSNPVENRRPQVVEGEVAPPPEARPPRYTLKTYEGGKQQYSAYWDSEGNPIENASQEGGRGSYSATYDPDENWVAGSIDEPLNHEHRFNKLHFEADESGKVNKITRFGSQQRLSQKEYADVIQRIEAKNQEFLSELRQGEAAPPTPEAAPELYASKDMAVRTIKKRDGSTKYGLFRPYDNRRSIIAEFDTPEEANFHARYYTEEAGGSFAAEHRHAADRAWEEYQRTQELAQAEAELFAPSEEQVRGIIGMLQEGQPQLPPEYTPGVIPQEVINDMAGGVETVFTPQMGVPEEVHRRIVQDAARDLASNIQSGTDPTTLGYLWETWQNAKKGRFNDLQTQRIEAWHRAETGAPPAERPAAQPITVTPTRTTTALGADPSKIYDMQFEVVSLDDLIASHSTDLRKKNPAYIDELQPRIRNRKASEDQVNSIVAKFNPDGYLVDTHRLDSGPMIVGPDNMVESGNGRTIALRRMLEDSPEKFAAYQERMKELLPQYGIDPAELEGINNPVLIRRSPQMAMEDRVNFVTEANAPPTMRMSAFEQSLQDANAISDTQLSTLTIGENQSIDGALNSSANIDLVRSFLDRLPENERATLMDAEGGLSRAGLERLKSALFAKTYPGETGRRLLQVFSESVDTGIKNFENAMYASLPDMAKSESAVRAGKLTADLSIADDITVVVDAYHRLRSNNMSIVDYLGQMTLEPHELNEFQRALLGYLAKNARYPKRLREMLKGYAQEVLRQAPAGQMEMFAGARLTKGEMLQNVVNQLAPQEQLPLFAGLEGAVTPVQEAPSGAPGGEELAQPVAGGAAGGGEIPPGVPPEAPPAPEEPVRPERPEPIVPEVTPETAPAVGPQPAGVLEDVMGSPYFRTVQDWDAWQQKTVPVINSMQERMLAGGKNQFDFANLSEAGRNELERYLRTVSSDMASERIATQRWAENLRDQALLNYSRRVGIDNYLTPLFPYQFWYTRSMLQWAMRAFDRPKWFSNYARLRNFQRNTMSQPGFPSRMRDKISISAPYLPEWTGGKTWVDPVGKSFPFEEFLRPLDLHAQDKDQVTVRAQSILAQWGNDGTAGQRDIALAMATKEGELWSRAVAEAQKELDNGEPAPFDFMNLILSPALYLTLPTFLATGKDPLTGRTDMPLLPITRTGKSIQAVTENTPLDALGKMAGGIMSWPEEAWRKRRGLSEFGDWGDYYIDRMLSNMAAEGYDTKEILIAMNERQGPLYDEAVNRVQLETALRVPGALPAYGALRGAAWNNPGDFAAALAFGFLPSGLLPEGELKQRGLAQIYKGAREQYNQGDSEAYNRFMDEHPEYEARLALWDKPEERLRQFLVSEVWDSYTNLSRVDKQNARKDLGTLFEQGFLNSETRDYNEFDVPTLAYFANYLHGQVPQTPETAAVTGAPDIMQDKLDLAPPGEAAAVDAYRSLREQLFPNWYALQTWYFSLDKGERKKFLTRFPQLADYWDWSKAYKAQNPVIDKYTTKPDESQVEYPQAVDYSFVQEFSPALSRQLLSYFFAGTPLSSGTNEELRYIWQEYGMPGGDFDTFMNDVLANLFTP